MIDEFCEVRDVLACIALSGKPKVIGAILRVAVKEGTDGIEVIIGSCDVSVNEVWVGVN